MALKLSASDAAKVAIQSIGRGYDVSLDLRLKYCKGDSRLIVIDEDQGRDIVLSGGTTISGVSKSIKCDKGERTRFRSDVVPFQQVKFLPTYISYFNFLHFYNTYCLSPKSQCFM